MTLMRPLFQFEPTREVLMTRPSATLSYTEINDKLVVSVDSTVRLYDPGVDTGNRDETLRFSCDPSVTNWGGAGLTDIGQDVCRYVAALFDEVTCHDGFQLVCTLPSDGMRFGDMRNLLDTVAGICRPYLDVTSESPVLARA